MNIQKTWKKYLLLLIISFLQITFIAYPNIALFYVLINQSLSMALIAGFILDLYSPHFFGLNIFVFVFLALFFNFLTRKIFKPNYIYYIIIGLISLGYSLIFMLR